MRIFRTCKRAPHREGTSGALGKPSFSGAVTRQDRCRRLSCLSNGDRHHQCVAEDSAVEGTRQGLREAVDWVQSGPACLRYAGGRTASAVATSANDQVQGHEGSSSVDGGARASEGSVLVVDDQEANVTLLADLLHVHGFAVERAASGEEALATIERHAPDIVLLDVMMPGLSGLDVCQRLR